VKRWQWYSPGGSDTWVLLVEHTDDLVPEWRPSGHIMKRQIYKDLGPRFHWWRYEEDKIVWMGSSEHLSVAFKQLKDAVIATEPS